MGDYKSKYGTILRGLTKVHEKKEWQLLKADNTCQGVIQNDFKTIHQTVYQYGAVSVNSLINGGVISIINWQIVTNKIYFRFYIRSYISKFIQNLGNCYLEPHN